MVTVGFTCLKTSILKVMFCTTLASYKTLSWQSLHLLWAHIHWNFINENDVTPDCEVVFFFFYFLRWLLFPLKGWGTLTTQDNFKLNITLFFSSTSSIHCKFYFKLGLWLCHLIGSIFFHLFIFFSPSTTSTSTWHRYISHFLPTGARIWELVSNEFLSISLLG